MKIHELAQVARNCHKRIIWDDDDDEVAVFVEKISAPNPEDNPRHETIFKRENYPQPTEEDPDPKQRLETDGEFFKRIAKHIQNEFKSQSEQANQ